jgi:16S rRNA (uracil1498-N3)-methyltransferase
VTVSLLVTPAELEGVDLVIDGEAYHHLFRATRLASGDPVRAVDGRGRARDGVVTRVERRRAVARLGAAAPSREPRLKLELLVAAPRPSRVSWLVEKGTEIGVHAFRFLDCERGERPLDAGALERLRRVARAAVEQCGRSWLPEVTASHRLEEALGSPDRAGLALVLDPAAEAGPCQLGPALVVPVRLVVGPEGGLTAAEVAAAVRLGARPMRLMPSILRIETAALAAAAWLLLQGECGADGASDPGTPASPPGPR